MSMRLAIAAAALLSPVAARAQTVDAVWTAAAERAFVTRQAKGVAGRLPEVRAYDGEGRLILRLLPAGPNTDAALRAALARPRVVDGPGLADALSALERRGGGAVAPGARFTIVDYWATWCAPCKPVSAALDRFMANRPAGVVLVRAETDFVAAQRRARASD